MAHDDEGHRDFAEQVTGSDARLRGWPAWLGGRVAKTTGARALTTVVLAAALLSAGCGSTSGPESAACADQRVEYDRLTELVGDGLGRITELTAQMSASPVGSREGMAAYTELETILPVWEQFVFEAETLVGEHRGCFTDEERDEVVRAATLVRDASGR